MQPYTPHSIVSIFNAHITPAREEQRIIQIKGIYEMGKSNQTYGGFYYDTLKDETNPTYKLTLKVPPLLRKDLPNGEMIDIKGFITRRISSYGKIEIHLNLSEILNIQKKAINSTDLKTIEVLQKKQALGYKNCDQFIRNKLYKTEIIKIGFLYGLGAITDKDVTKMWTGGMDKFAPTFTKVNFNSTKDILLAVKKMEANGNELICLFRGGGDQMERFNDPDLAEGLLHLNAILVTALGHGVDNTLVRKISDKPLITPSALGTYLTNIVNESTEAFAASKAKIVSDTKKTIEEQYKEKIKNLDAKLKAENTLHQKTLAKEKELYQKEVLGFKNRMTQLEKTNHETNQLVSQYQAQNKLNEDKLKNLQEQQSKSAPNWIYIIIAFILGLVIAFFLSHL